MLLCFHRVGVGANGHRSINNNATFRAELLRQWERHRTGPLVTSGASHVAWVRIPRNSSIFEVSPDPSAGTNTPHLELIIEVRAVKYCEDVHLTPTRTKQGLCR